MSTDPDKVREILGNLLTNAAKHASDAKNVSIRVARASKVASWVAITVTDDGPGIASGTEDEIFGEFVRGEGSAGSGVGLAIARKLARLLGGDLFVDQQPPAGGAAFTLHLPIRSATEEAAAVSARASST